MNYTEVRYAIIIATRNRGSKITATLDSIKNSADPNFEVFIIDQSTNFETKDAVAPYLVDSRFRYVFSEIKGTCYARNLGVSLSTAPYIVITDDDCIAKEDWLPKITAPFDEHPNVGVVFCTVEPLPFDWSEGYTPHIIYDKNHIVRTPAEAQKGIGHGLGLGAGMAIRRTAFEQLEGFDQTLGPGREFPSAEDKDFAFRSLYNGWWVYENADIEILHDGFRTMEEVRNLTKRDFYGVGGTFGKYIKAGHWGMARLILSWLLTFGVLNPLKAVLRLERPRGFKRFYYLLQGVLAGLRKEVNPDTIQYVPDSKDPSPNPVVATPAHIKVN